MATLSAETQAIIQRLKDEGELVRNRGTNSIRSVKIEMAKFENVFNTISANIAEQTNILRQQTTVAQEALEQQRTREQLEELEIEKQKYDDDDNSRRQETDKKIEDIGDSITRALSLKNIALAGAGLFVGYNLLKGFINEQTGGGFDRMLDTVGDTDWSGFTDAAAGLGNVAWDGVATTLNSMNAGLSGIDWVNFASAVNMASTRLNDFNTWLGETGIGDIASTVLGAGLVGVGVRGAVQGALSGPGGRAGFASRLTRLPGGIATAITGLTLYYGDDIKSWLEEQGASTETADFTTKVIQITSGALSLGLLFGAGAPGLIAIAAAGTAIALGGLIRNWIINVRDRQTADFNQQVQDTQASIDAAMNGEMTPADRDNITNMLSQARRRQQLAISDALRADAAAAEAAAQAALAEEPMSATNGVNQLQISRIFREAMAGDPAAIAELQEFARGRERETSGDLLRFSSESTFIRRMLEGFGSEIFNTENMEGKTPDMLRAEQDRWDGLVQQMMQNMGYRSGTKGFQDFGDGTFSILHGREAVVPYNTAAGRFLDQYFTENWEPRIANAQRLQTAAQGGGGGAVIINAPTTVSPVVNNVSGGRSVNQVSIRGGGGGGGGLFGSSNPYGLPYTVN